jgi:Ca-activated chloride channel family protein
MKLHYKRTLLLSVLVFCVCQSAEAGGKLYGRFPNQVNSPVFDLQLRKFKTTVEIQDQFAVVHVDETFYNANASTLEGIYFFEMPAGSKLTEMFLWINGQRVEQVIKRREEAVQQYEQIVRRMTDPLLAEQVAENVFRLRLFPLPPRSERRLEIKYIQPLPIKSNAIEFLFPLRLENYGAKLVDSAAVHVDFNLQSPVDSLWFGPQVPLSTIRVTEISATRYAVDFKATQTAFEYDFSFYFRPQRLPLFNTLKYVSGKPNDDGYYLTWLNPPNRFFPATGGSRQFVFCSDISASMIGTRLAQVKQALNYFVEQLQPDDRFNIVAFNTDVYSFTAALVQAGAANKARAKTYVQTLSASGLTNLNGALTTALAMLTSTAGQAQLLLISDGQPTWGETRTDSVLANVKRSNRVGATIFPIGLGSDLNKDFFQTLAQQNGAAAFFIGETENAADRLVEIYRTITAPILTNVQITAQNIAAYDVFPATVPNLSAGMQFLQAGRYVPPFLGKLQFRANSGTTIIDTAVAVDLRNAPDNKYVSRFWAAQKIQALLKDIERFGQRPELINAVVYLSINYSILSPYTAFLVIEPGLPTTAVDDKTDPNLPRAFSLLQNYPNPFSPAGAFGQNFTTIRYTIPANIPAAGVIVELKIYNLLGQVVRVLMIRQQTPGEYSIQWDGADEAGHLVPAGVYLVRLVAGDPSTRSGSTGPGQRFVAERKVVVLR